MIQIITVTARATCINCQTEIHRGKGDLDRDETWWHDMNGKVTCPGSPHAQPHPGSIREETP